MIERGSEKRGGGGAWGEVAKVPFAGRGGRETMMGRRRETTRAIAAYEERHGREMTSSEMAAIARAEASFYGEVRRDASGNLYAGAGKVFEKGLRKILIDEFGYDMRKNGGFVEKVRNVSTREPDIAEDVLEGVDVVVNQMPVDITLNSEKTGEIGSVDENGEVAEGFLVLGELGGVRVSSGFRMTNGSRRLETPVCVMLFEGAEERMEPEEMVRKIRENRQEFRGLADDAFSSYWDYADAVEVG